MTIPQQLQQFVDGAIASGKYRSQEEVVSTALLLLQERERKLNALRGDLQIGIYQLEKGEGIPIADEGAHQAFFNDIERRGQERFSKNR